MAEDRLETEDDAHAYVSRVGGITVLLLVHGIEPNIENLKILVKGVEFFFEPTLHLAAKALIPE